MSPTSMDALPASMLVTSQELKVNVLPLPFSYQLTDGNLNSTEAEVS